MDKEQGKETGRFMFGVRRPAAVLIEIHRYPTLPEARRWVEIFAKEAEVTPIRELLRRPRPQVADA